MVSATRPRWGIALDATHLVAVADGGGALRTIPLTPFTGDAVWPDLVAAIAQLGPAGDLAVALLPPLVEVRDIALPPLRSEEVVQLLTRNAASYFATVRGPQAIGVLLPSTRRDASGTVIAMAAPVTLIAAIHAAAREAGWQITAVTCAEAAWAAAAMSLWPQLRRRTSHFVVGAVGRTTLLELAGGRLRALRRFHVGEADGEAIAAAIGSRRSAAVAGVGATGMAAVLTRHGVATLIAPDAMRNAAASPDILAATFALRAVGPLLRSEAVVTTERNTLRRATFIVSAVAVVLIVLAAALELWSVRHALRAVQADRAALRPQLSATLIGRSSVEDAYRRLAAIAAADRSAPHWSAVLGDLTARLPDDAYVSTVRARGDSLTIDGVAVSAARAYDAVAASPLLSQVHAPAPVRRLSPEGGTATERFTLAGQLRDSAALLPVRAGAMP